MVLTAVVVQAQGQFGVRDFLEPYLPVPRVEKSGDQYILNSDHPLTIGRVRSFFGNVGVLVRAYCYIRTLGGSGLKALASKRC